MNEKMAFFLFEVAQKTVKIHRNRGMTPFDIGVFNPFPQFPKWKHSGLSPMDKHFINEHGSGYRLHPEHSRPGLGGAAAAVLAPTVIPAIGVASVALASYGQAELIEEVVETENYLLKIRYIFLILVGN
jgi:hypothetical protein